MSHNAMFPGLVVDETGTPATVAHIGGEAFYVIDDQGFHRHIEAEKVDRQAVNFFMEQLKGNEGMAVDQAMQMTGQDDLFARAAMDAEIRNLDAEDIVGQIIPPQARDMLAMMGFRIVIDYRGDIIRMDQPGLPDDEE